jgi:hypothetical protein
MGLLCDYFVAPSDEQAAATIDNGPSLSSQIAPTRSRRPSLFRRPAGAAPTSPASTGSAFPTLTGNGIEPVVQMGTLEELLTGRPYDDVMEANPDGTVAVRDGGERLVTRLADTLTEALASASDDRLAEIAVPWSETEEFWGAGDPEVLVPFLRQFAQLARTARLRDEHLYCWVSA